MSDRRQCGWDGRSELADDSGDERLEIAPGRLSLHDGAALFAAGAPLAVGPGKLSATGVAAAQMKRSPVQRVPGEDAGDAEGADHFVPVSRDTLAEIDRLLASIGASRQDVPTHEVITSTTAAENSRGEQADHTELAWQRRRLEFGPAARQDAAREEPPAGSPHGTQSPAAPEEERQQMTPRWGLSLPVANYRHWHDLPQVARRLREGSRFQQAFASGMDRVITRPDPTGQQMYDAIFDTIWELSMQVEQGHVAHLTVYISGHGGSDGVFGVDERDGPSLRNQDITSLGRLGSEHNVHVTFIIDSCNAGVMVNHAQAEMSRDLEGDIDDNRTDAAELRQRLRAVRELAHPGFRLSAALLGLYNRRPLRTERARSEGRDLYAQYVQALNDLEGYLVHAPPEAPDLSRVRQRIGRARACFNEISESVNNRNMHRLRTATAPLLDGINDAVNAGLVSVRDQLGEDASPHAGRALGNPQQGAGRSLGNPVQRRASAAGGADDLAVAADGVTGPGEPLPFLERIQSAFGRHDLSGVRAHRGDAAREASSQLGALAYATGADVAFAEAPDLHTAAHEAAHVVQQRAGVSLAGGFGAEGDEHERHADEVADAVVRGEDAEPLLDRGVGASRSGRAPVRAPVAKWPPTRPHGYARPAIPGDEKKGTIYREAEVGEDTTHGRASEEDLEAVFEPSGGTELDLLGGATNEEKAEEPPRHGALAKATRESSSRPLPEELREELERALGQSLSDVRVHTGSVAARAAQSIGARAFALGRDIYFVEGAYDPESPRGRELIAHEVAHAAAAPSPGAAEGLEISDPQEAAEVEADRFARDFARGSDDVGQAEHPMPPAAGGTADVHRFPGVVPDALAEDQKRFIDPANPSRGKVWEPSRGYLKNSTATRLGDIVEGGKIKGKFANGTAMYVVDKDGTVWVGHRQGLNMPHPTLIGGKKPQIQAAGMLETRKGKIVRIDNHSGHFRPPRSALKASSKSFLKFPAELFDKKFRMESVHFKGRAEYRKAFRSLRMLKLRKLKLGKAIKRLRMRYKYDPRFRGRLKGIGRAGLAIIVALVVNYFFSKWMAELEEKRIKKDLERLQPLVQAALEASITNNADTFDALFESDPKSKIYMNIVYRIGYFKYVDPEDGVEKDYQESRFVSAEFSTTSIEPGLSYDFTDPQACGFTNMEWHRLQMSEELEVGDLFQGVAGE